MFLLQGELWFGTLAGLKMGGIDSGDINMGLFH
jgi:hypothetical protein